MMLTLPPVSRKPILRFATFRRKAEGKEKVEEETHAKPIKVTKAASSQMSDTTGMSAVPEKATH